MAATRAVRPVMIPAAAAAAATGLGAVAEAAPLGADAAAITSEAVPMAAGLWGSIVPTTRSLPAAGWSPLPMVSPTG
jgi:hypothetical protein